MSDQICNGIDCAWCTNPECPKERKDMTDKETVIECPFLIIGYGNRIGCKVCYTGDFYLQECKGSDCKFYNYIQNVENRIRKLEGQNNDRKDNN